MNVQILGAAYLVVAMALMPATAAAQNSRPLSVGVMGGMSVPTGNMGNDREIGFNLTGSVYLRPGAGQFMFRGDVGYDRFEGNRRFENLNVALVTASIRVPIGSAAVEGGIRPYFVGGGGLYRRTTDIVVYDAPRETRSSNDFGVAFGAGVEFGVARFNIFAEARFVSVFGDRRDVFLPSARWIPVTLGVRF